MSPGLKPLLPPPELLDTLLIPLVCVVLEPELETISPAFALDICAERDGVGVDFEGLKGVA
jgi:hypothetical protein